MVSQNILNKPKQLNATYTNEINSKQELNSQQCNFFLTGIHSLLDRTATTIHGVTRKRSTSRLKYTGNRLERTYS